LIAETGPRKRFAASLLLAAAALSCLAAWRLKSLGDSLGHIPPGPAGYFLAFAASVAIAYTAGHLAPRRADPETEGSKPGARPGRLFKILPTASAILCLALFVVAWALKGHRPPATILVLWGMSFVAGAGILAGTRRKAAPSSAQRRSLILWIVLFLVLVAAVRARVIGLDRVPAAFGGDEASQALDGMDLLQGGPAGDPFGMGWGSTIRLGMLPAGAGALWRPDVVAGPRLPYAIAGSLSVAACAAAAGVAAGPLLASSDPVGGRGDEGRRSAGPVSRAPSVLPRMDATRSPLEGAAGHRPRRGPAGSGRPLERHRLCLSDPGSRAGRAGAGRESVRGEAEASLRIPVSTGRRSLAARREPAHRRAGP
jgi:hypothetical protein